ncbi:Sodium/hydrogen exchanger 1 [Mactra antiquata]
MENLIKTPFKTFSLLKICLCTCIILCLVNCVTAHEGKKNESNSERYPLVVFDFERVELPFVICLWVLIASLAKIGFHLHSKLPTWVPESCLLIVLGLIVGCILHFGRVATTSEYVLDADIFFIYLLPPIIFDAGYFMPIRSFFDNIGSVLLLAVVNTAFNTACIGFSLYAVAYWGWIGQSISLLHCLIFSALISAVDPVAVISVFEEVHVNQMLYIIVFGESLLNDGVTVVLYHMMEGFIELGEENLIAIDVVTGIGSFFIIALGGTLIGILYGLFGGFITKYTDHVKVIEPLFVFILGYLMYLTSEMMHLSGILALSFGGIVLRHYMEHNVSKKTATTIKYFMKMLANISETIIFMFLGLSTIVDTLDWNLAFIFFALFFCLIFRALGVVVLSWFLNRRRLVKLTKIDQFIMAYGGLRGGIAFCLALSLDEELVPEKRLFVTATIIIVFFTVFVQGISVKPVVNALKVKRQTGEDPSLNEKIHETMLDHFMAGVEGIASRSSHNLMRTRFRRFNHKYLQPILAKEKAKPKAAKIVKVYHETTEQHAMKVSNLDQMKLIPGSSADLYDDHKKALLLRGSPMLSQGRDEDTVTLQKALRAGKPPGWQMNRRHTIADSVESVNQVVYHKKQTTAKDDYRSNTTTSPVTNGTVMKTEDNTKSDSTTSDSEFAGVTINFTTDTTKDTTINNTSLRQSTNSDISPLPSTHQEMSPVGETVAEKTLPWQDSCDPSPTHLADNIPSNEPVIAHVPTWVNNLSYSHITETGSPYVSPQTTVIPPVSNYHKTVYSIFPPTDDNSDNQKGVISSDYFPTPWNNSNLEECPVVSPMVMESGARSEDLLHSTHTEQAPDHHHVIVPSLHHIESSNSSGNHKAHLTEVASAPDFQHWKPLGGFLNESSRYNNESDTMLSEMAFVEGVKSRVQEWLKQATDDEENDADDDDDGEPDGLKSAEDLELELDLQMNGYRLKSSSAK